MNKPVCLEMLRHAERDLGKHLNRISRVADALENLIKQDEFEEELNSQTSSNKN